MVKRIFKPRQSSAALNWGINGNTAAPREREMEMFLCATTVSVISVPMTNYASTENGFCEYACG